MNTTRHSRKMLMTRHAAAKVVPLEVDGHTLVERKSKRPVGIISAQTPQLAAARARYSARAYTMAPYLVRDVDELMDRFEQAQQLLSRLPEQMNSDPIIQQVRTLVIFEEGRPATHEAFTPDNEKKSRAKA